MSSVLITGAGGYAGGRLLASLRERGVDVVAGVRNRARKLAFERMGIKSLVCDVADPINVARVVAAVRADGVAHLAGISDPGAALREPLDAYQSNVNSWAYLLDAVRRATPRARVLLVSSADVYGASAGDGQMLNEETPLRPTSLFGSWKALAEDVARTYFREYHVNLSIVRTFPYTGPHQPATANFGRWARQLANDGVARAASWELDQQRDLLHCDDVVSAYEKLLWNGKPGEAYNLATGHARPLREHVQELAKIAGGRLDETGDKPSPGKRPVPHLSGDASRLRTELGWTATRTPQDAIRDLWSSLAARTVAAPVATGG